MAIKAASDSQWQDLATKVKSKQDALTSGTNIKTINGNSVLGSGNLNILDGGFPTYEAVRLASADDDYHTAFRVDVDNDFSIEAGKVYFIRFTEGSDSGKYLELDFYKDNVALGRYTYPDGVAGKGTGVGIRCSSSTTSSGRVHLMYVSFPGYSSSFSTRFLDYTASSVVASGYRVQEIGTYSSTGPGTPNQTGTFSSLTALHYDNNTIAERNSGITIIDGDEATDNMFKVPYTGAKVTVSTDFTISTSWGGTVNVEVSEFNSSLTQRDQVKTYTYTKTANQNLRINIPYNIFSDPCIEVKVQLVNNTTTATISGEVGVEYVYGEYAG